MSYRIPKKIKFAHMKKISLLFLILLLVSCGASSSKTSNDNSLYEVLIQQDNGGASIRFFEILSDEKEIKMLQNDKKLKNKIKPSDIQTSSFIVLNLGEKAPGDYNVEIESVVETDKNVIITIKEAESKSTATVAQEIMTPYSIVKINSKKEIIFK